MFRVLNYNQNYNLTCWFIMFLVIDSSSIEIKEGPVLLKDICSVVSSGDPIPAFLQALKFPNNWNRYHVFTWRLTFYMWPPSGVWMLYAVNMTRIYRRWRKTGRYTQMLHVIMSILMLFNQSRLNSYLTFLFLVHCLHFNLTCCSGEACIYGARAKRRSISKTN